MTWFFDVFWGRMIQRNYVWTVRSLAIYLFLMKFSSWYVSFREKKENHCTGKEIWYSAYSELPITVCVSQTESRNVG